MKKYLLFFILLIFVCVCTTACVQTSSSKNMIQSKRRFADYIEPQNSSDPNRVDISEGPKLKYDARFGPQNLDFEIKIIDPY